MLQALFARLRKHLIPAMGLILLTLAVYGQTVGYDFLSNWDDNLYVTYNPDIQGVTAKNLVHLFSTSYVGNYAPVHLLSYMLDFQLVGMNPAWFHGVNVVLHIVNGLLFYLLVRRLTGKPFWAFASSALFLLHPVQVESVAWISQRKNLLAMFFSLCSFLSYIAYRQRTEKGRKRAYTFSIIFLVLALLSKSVAVIMPFVFLLYDIFLEKAGRRKGIIVDKIPYFAAAAVTSVVALITQSFEKGGGSFDYFAGNMAAKILTMLTVLTSYLHILIWPSNLKLIYIFGIKTGVDGEVIFALLLVGALCCAGIYLLRREQRLFFGFALFFLGLVPVSQIVPLVTLMNDRYLYFPMLGAAWVAGGGLSRLNDMFPEKRVNPAHLLISLILVFLVPLSYQRAEVWQNSVTLWIDAAKKLPTKETRASLAEAYLNSGQTERALTTYNEVFASEGGFSEPAIERKALNEAAGLYINAGLLVKAKPLLATLTTKFPDFFPGFINLGYCYYLSRDQANAEKAYRQALSIEPGSSQALVSLGNICLETGRVAEARALYQKSYENGGNSPDLQYNMACVEALSKDYEKSLQHLEEALKLGYRNLEAITRNPELDALRRLPSFNRLIAGYFPENNGRYAPQK
ncbi:MAG: tetratricopeptide repeat protein [Oryzomonas sp.]|uniref:tetratricopeptide repeat protein n=1 Tax=Oryzomonas sp. TaxID=2855186 RepID=UPI0028482492|nr:tetratricopeptide repeat protein [Oryzomonas sp.]MDR3580386.1 tetratricopeptide repeat protein [Oryzomonas sp.]